MKNDDDVDIIDGLKFDSDKMPLSEWVDKVIKQIKVDVDRILKSKKDTEIKEVK